MALILVNYVLLFFFKILFILDEAIQAFDKYLPFPGIDAYKNQLQYLNLSKLCSFILIRVWLKHFCYLPVDSLIISLAKTISNNEIMITARSKTWLGFSVTVSAISVNSWDIQPSTVVASFENYRCAFKIFVCCLFHSVLSWLVAFLLWSFFLEEQVHK